MSVSEPRFRSLELAACGWLPVDWEQMFCPEDLPKDWRVSYYANEFSCVLLPAVEWDNPLVQAAFWRAEVSPGFRFYLEITPSLLHAAHWSQVREAVDRYLFPHVKGLLLPDEIVGVLPGEWQSHFPLHVQQPNEWLAIMPSNAEAQTGLLREYRPLAPQALRSVFERLQAQTAHPDVTLFLDVPWSTLEQLRLMQQLYGV